MTLKEPKLIGKIKNYDLESRLMQKLEIPFKFKKKSIQFI